MPTARANGVELYYEETGSGFPLIWSHEFGGDYRSWEPQVRYFSRRYRVITYNYRGYPPSSVPDDPAAYRSEILIEDLAALMRHLGIAKAHVGGLSMGGNVALNFGIRYPEMAASLIIAGCGSGTVNREASAPGSRTRARTGRGSSSKRGPAPRPTTLPAWPHAAALPTRTRAAGRSSSATCASTRPRARPICFAACRSAARRSMSSRPNSRL